jgi:hypothetical protein
MRMYWTNFFLLALSGTTIASRWRDSRQQIRISVDKPDNSTAPTKKWIIEFEKVIIGPIRRRGNQC